MKDLIMLIKYKNNKIWMKTYKNKEKLVRDLNKILLKTKTVMVRKNSFKRQTMTTMMMMNLTY